MNVFRLTICLLILISVFSGGCVSTYIIDEKINIIRNGDNASRDSAARELVQIGGAAAPQLETLLYSDDPAVRAKAVWALGEIRASSSLSKLVLLLGDPDKTVREEICSALLKYGPGQVSSAVASDLDQQTTDEGKISSARILGETGKSSSKSMPALIGLFSEKNERVRDEAVKASIKLSPESIRPLLAPLCHYDSQISECARKALAGIGKDASDCLVEELADADSNKKATIIFLLGEIRDEKALPALIGTFDQEDYKVRLNAAEAVAKYGAQALPLLKEKINGEPSPRVLETAAWALGLSETAEASELLQSLLSNENKFVRLAAIGAISKLNLKSEKLLSSIVSALKDESWEIRKFAAESLRKSKWKPSAGQLSFLLMADQKWNELAELKDSGSAQEALKIALKDQEKWVRQSAEIALAKIGKRNLDSILALLDASSGEDARNIIEAAGETGDKKVLPHLEKFLAAPEWQIRKAAVEAIGKIKGPRLVEVSDKLAKDENVLVRKSVAEALGMLASRETFAPLSQMLSDPAWFVRKAAVISIGKIGVQDKDITAALEGGLRDHNEMVRKASLEMLKARKWKPGSDSDRIAELIAAKDWPAVRKSGENAIPQVADLLKDESIDNKVQACLLLGGIGGEKALVPLREAFLEMKIPEVKKAAAAAILESRAKKEASEILSEALDRDEPLTRDLAVSATGDLGFPSETATKKIIAILEDDDHIGIRKNAAGALGKLKAAESAESLIDLTGDPDEDSALRIISASSLAKIASPENKDDIAELVAQVNSEIGGLSDEGKKESCRTIVIELEKGLSNISK